MVIPQNLADVIDRVKPQAILLLDTNTILNNPRIPSYQVTAPGTFLLVIPQVVDNEIMALKLGNRDKATKQKAARAIKATDEVYRRGNPERGVEVRNSLWVVTVQSVRPERPSDGNRSIEDDQVRKNLGAVDAALLRLAEACREEVPDMPALLITVDTNLSRVARVRGLRACSLSDLRKPEILNDMLVTDHPIQPLDLDTLLSPDEEQPVKVALTLEELRSEGDDLIARGSGRLTWQSEGYPFRWTFPYKNAEKVKNLEDWVPHEVMPLENVDFWGNEEKLPEEVRRFVCLALEQSAPQSPQFAARQFFNWLVDTIWLTTHPDWIMGKSPEELEAIKKLSQQYDEHIEPLMNGTLPMSVSSYLEAYEAYKALAKQTDGEPVHEDFMLDIEFLCSNGLDSWFVGNTIEEDYTYEPFQWDDEEEEAAELSDEEMDDGEDDYEEVVED